MSNPTQSNIVFLANFDGSDADTIYWPEISPERPVFNGDAQLDGAVTLFGNTTAYVDGAGDSITWGIASDCQFLNDLTSSYMIELHARRTTLAASGILLSTRDTACGITLESATNGTLTFSVYGDSALVNTASTGSGVISAAAMSYIKILNDPVGGIQIYVDGALEASALAGTIGTPVNTNAPLTLGTSAGGTTGQCEVNFGPIRITSGETLPDTDVPVAAFPYVPIDYDPFANYLNQLANFIGDDGDTYYIKEIGGVVPTFVASAQIDSDSLLLNGTTDWITFENSILYLYDGTASWTVEVLFQADTQHTGWLINNFGNLGTSSNEAGFGLLLEPSTTTMTVKARVQRALGVVQSEITSSVDSIPVGSDVLVTVTYELGVGMALFIDGIADGTDVVFPNPTTSIAGKVLLGQYNSQFFDGNIKNIRFYKGLAKPARNIVGNPILPFPGFPAVTATADFINNPVFATGFSDITTAITSDTVTYTMKLSGTQQLEIPISVWQGTISVDTSIYLQCFIPNVEDYVDEINARIATGERFTIYRSFSLGNSVATVAVLDAPIELTTFSQNTSAYSCLMAGYGDSLSAPASPVTYQLTGIRSVNQSAAGLMRVRADIDWLIKPGDVADTGYQTFTITYITYYTNVNESYMDIGER